MIRALFALYPGICPKGISAIINGITNDRKREDDVEFVDKKASNQSTNKVSVIRADIQEHRAVMGLPNPTDKISELKKIREDTIASSYVISCFWTENSNARQKWSWVGKTEDWDRRKAFLMGKRFYIVPMCTIKSHFVSIDSAVLHGIMKEISPEFDVSREEFYGENRETFWKNIFDFKRLRVSKQKVLTGMIDTDGVALCVHYRRLKRDRPVPPSAAPVTNHECEKEADPAAQEVQDSDFRWRGEECRKEGGGSCDPESAR